MTKEHVIAEVKKEIKYRKEFYPRRARLGELTKEEVAFKIAAMETVLKIILGTSNQLILDLKEVKPEAPKNQIKLSL